MSECRMRSNVQAMSRGRASLLPSEHRVLVKALVSDGRGVVPKFDAEAVS